MTSRLLRSLWPAPYLSVAGSRFVMAANAPGYIGPVPSRLAAGIKRFAIDYPPPPDALELAGRFCLTDCGPQDAERWQQARDDRARRLAEKQAHYAAQAAERRRSAPRRRFGPYVLDANNAPEKCPCCLQQIDDMTWDTMSYGAQPE